MTLWVLGNYYGFHTWIYGTRPHQDIFQSIFLPLLSPKKDKGTYWDPRLHLHRCSVELSVDLPVCEKRMASECSWPGASIQVHGVELSIAWGRVSIVGLQVDDCAKEAMKLSVVPITQEPPWGCEDELPSAQSCLVAWTRQMSEEMMRACPTYQTTKNAPIMYFHRSHCTLGRESTQTLRVHSWEGWFLLIVNVPSN